MLRSTLACLAMLLCSAGALAAELEISSAGVSVSDDSLTTTYSGDVHIRVPAGMAMKVKAKATQATDGGGQIVSGDVVFNVGDLIISTDKARISHEKNGDTTIEMDEAQSKNADGK